MCGELTYVFRTKSHDLISRTIKYFYGIESLLNYVKQAPTNMQ